MKYFRNLMTKYLLYQLIMFSPLVIFSQNERTGLKLELTEMVERPVIAKGDAGTEDNLYGFEGGTVVKLDEVYHLFTAEIFGEPKVVKTRLGHWTSNNGKIFSREGTLFESSGNFDGSDDRASLWSPMPVFNDSLNQWELFYVTYRSAPKLPGKFSELNFRHNTHGKIVRAVSIQSGKQGIGGPYEDVGVILEPGEKSDWWEGIQGTDSFYPFKIKNKWLSFYGSWRSNNDWNNKLWFGVGLVSSSTLEGPWERCSKYNPVLINPVFVENPIVYPLNDSVFICVFDTGFDPNSIGYSFSKDGYHWEKEQKIIFPEGDPVWRGEVRTPLSFIPDGDGNFLIYYTAFSTQVFENNKYPEYHSGFGTLGLIKVKVDHE